MTAPRPRPLFSLVLYGWLSGFVVVFLVVGLLVLPWTLLFDRDRRVAARIASWVVRMTIRVPRAWRGAAADIDAVDLRRPAVVVMNHQSLGDIAVAVALPGAPRLCAKPWVGRIPLLRYAMWLAGHSVFDPANLADVRAMLDRNEGLVRRGVSVLFFPEGTRQARPTLGRFGSGAFEVARRTGADVLPVVLFGTGEIVPRGQILFHDAPLGVRPLERIAAMEDRAELSARTRAALQAALDAGAERSEPTGTQRSEARQS